MRVTWDYIAGFFDGEGSVSTMNFTHRDTLAGTIVTLSQTGEEGIEILQKMREFLLTQGVTGYVHSQKKRGRYRQMHHLKICARDSVKVFLTNMASRSSVKRLVVNDTLRFLIAFPSIRSAVTTERNISRGKQGALVIDVAALKADRAAGMSMKALAVKYDCNTYTIKKYLDPEYRVRYDAYRKTWRQRQVNKAKAARAA